jgi:serine protease Do
MGVLLTDVTPALQQALSLSVGRGALVQDFTSDSPAQRSGIRVYDIVTDINGQDIGSNEELIRDISARQPGDVVRVAVSRDGRHVTVPVRLVERPRGSEPSRAFPGDDRNALYPDTPLGLTVRELDRGFAGRFEVPSSVQGVVVQRVDPTGVAFSAQMRRNFVITEINRRPVRSVADYDRVVRSARPGDVLAFYYYDPSSGQRALLTVTVEP